MTTHHLPSVEALTGTDDTRWMAELKISEVRELMAVARALIDEVESVVPPSGADPLSAGEQASASGQVVQELAQVGWKLVELASALSPRHATGRPPDSHARILRTANACDAR